jgi:hypothetical protein
MRRNLDDRDIQWRVIDGVLERAIRPLTGKPYRHRCSRKAFEEVAWYLAEHASQGVTMTLIAAALDLPYTQVNVAMELLKERGILRADGRRSYVEPGYREALYEHAMVEFLALEAGVPPALVPAAGRDLAAQ